jgi:PPOX class probable F420-dependent enzyme
MRLDEWIVHRADEVRQVGHHGRSETFLPFAAKGGDARKEELEPELESVLFSRGPVRLEAHEREHEVGEVQVEDLRCLGIEAGGAKAAQHAIADSSLGLAFAFTAGQQGRRCGMILHQPAKRARDAPQLVPPARVRLGFDYERAPEVIPKVLEKLILALHVAVQRHRRDAELARNPADAQRCWAFPVGYAERGEHDLLARERHLTEYTAYVYAVDLHRKQEGEMSPVNTLDGEKYLSLTTYRRNGTPVSTPVWFVVDEGSLLVWTSAESWKAKRLRRDPRVRVAACSFRGKIHGAAWEGRARFLPDRDGPRVQRLLVAKYPVARRLLLWATRLSRSPRQRSIYLEILPATTA